MFCKGNRLKVKDIYLQYKNIKNNYVCAHARSRELNRENTKIYL